jgi:hypothetical protein
MTGRGLLAQGEDTDFGRRRGGWSPGRVTHDLAVRADDGEQGDAEALAKYQINKRRLMISRIISDVPDAMVQSRTSRKKRSTGNSRMYP